MEKCKIWIIPILSCLMLTLTISCNKDDDKKNSDGESVPTVNGKYLVRINSSELIYNAQGQLVKVKSRNANNNSSETTFSYEPKRIIMNNPDVVYHLKNGRISESRYTVITSMEEGAPIIDAKNTYEYDSNGYLIKETKPYDFAEEGTDMETTVYEWLNGNIHKITRSHYDYEEETTISYTAYPNTIPDITQGFILIGGFLSWQGYFGNRSKNLPESETVTSVNNYPDKTVTYHYYYTFEDGFVTKVTVNWTSNGILSTMVYELEWY